VAFRISKRSCLRYGGSLVQPSSNATTSRSSSLRDGGVRYTRTAATTVALLSPVPSPAFEPPDPMSLS